MDRYDGMRRGYAEGPDMEVEGRGGKGVNIEDSQN